MQFNYQLFNFENIKELSEIYELCFGVKHSESYFKWKYLDNPSGQAVAYVAMHGNRIAAFYGMIPETYVIGEKTEVIYQSMDTMTHPAYRRKGLFTILANKTYEHIKEKEGKLNIVGFPSESSHPGFIKKLNWTTLIELKYSFTYRAIFNLKNLFQRNSDIEINSTSSFNQEFDQYLNQKEKIETPIHRLIDQQYANWRFTSCPLVSYNILKITKQKNTIGYVVYHIDHKNRAFISGFDSKTTEDYSKNLRAITKHLFDKENVNSVFTFCSSSSILKNALKKNGFIKNPISKGPFSYRIPLIIYGDQSRNSVNFYDYQNWDIQPLLRDY